MAATAHDEWVALVLGCKISDAQELAKLRQAYSKLRPALSQAAQGSEGVAAAISDRRSAFEAALAAGDAAAAREALFELAALSKRTQAADAAATVPAGTVAAMKKALEQAQKRWDDALAEARTQAREVLDELATFYPAQAQAFEQKLDGYWREMTQTITAAQAQDAAKQRDQLIAAAASLRSAVMADPVFSYLDQNGVPVGPAFTTALEELNGTLAS